MHVEVLLRAGLPATITVGEPGVHGDVVTGMHGMGVNTPCAAAVAAATWGLLGVVHMPKGMMFFIGTWSIIVAAGILPALTRPSGVTVNELGATPKEQVNIAPEHTS
jgi:hypothetical protein